MKILMEYREIKTIEVEPHEVAAFEAGGWSRADTDPHEYAWMADEQSTHRYATKEEAEEFMGAPRQFRRMKAGPWKPVEDAS